MDGSQLIGTLNPAISTAFAIAFLVFWRFHPKRIGLLFFALSYAATAAAFVLQVVVLPIGLQATKMLSNALFLLAGVALAGSITARYRGNAPLVLLGAVAMAGYGLLAWFMFVQPSLGARVIVMNLALTAMALTCVAAIWRARDKRAADWLLLSVCLAMALNFSVRSAIVVSVEGPYRNGYVDFAGSLYWMTMAASHVLFSVFCALTLLLMTAFDALAEAKREADTDPLSGLLNRRGFQQRAERAIERSAALSLPATLVIADLDRFKDVNDRHGHAAGDAAITAFGTLLAELADTGIVAGRIGGEEFALVVENADLSTARLIAEGLRTALAARRLPGSNEESFLTASFGVAERRRGDDLFSLMLRADRALYDAKTAGRDRVSPHGDSRIGRSTDAA